MKTDPYTADTNASRRDYQDVLAKWGRRPPSDPALREVRTAQLRRVISTLDECRRHDSMGCTPDHPVEFPLVYRNGLVGRPIKPRTR